MTMTYGNIPESEKMTVPATAFDRKVRLLAEAAMSVCNHDCSPASVSGQVGREVRRCLCGEVDQAPDALRDWKRRRRKVFKGGEIDGK